MQKLLAYLGSIHPLSLQLQEHLLETLKVREVKKKELFLKAGHVCRSICFIDKGLLRCFYAHEENEVTSWFMKEGDMVVSIESFFRQVPSAESIVALEDCLIYYIDFNELQYIYRNYFEFNFIARVLLENYYILWTRQLYALRMKHGQERYDWLMQYHTDLMLRVPSKYIASWLGITEAHFSVVKGKRLA